MTKITKSQLAALKEKRKITKSELAMLQNGDLSFLQPQVKEEMPDELKGVAGTFARTVVKNLSNNPESSVKYLQSKFPEMEFKNQDGKILAKNKNDKDYGVLDPEGFDVRDILDIGYDIMSGIGEGVATGVGVMLGGGLGSIPAAMAAGAGTSAASEALRQKLGQLLGIPQDVSGADVATSAAIGGGLPLAGKAGKAGLNLAWEGVKKAAPRAASIASGIPKRTIDNLTQYYDEVKNLASKGNAGLRDLAANTRNKLQTLLNRELQKTGKGLEQAVSAADSSVSMVNIKDLLESELAKAQKIASEHATDANKQKVRDIRNFISENFAEKKQSEYYAPFEPDSFNVSGGFQEKPRVNFSYFDESTPDNLIGTDAIDANLRRNWNKGGRTNSKNIDDNIIDAEFREILNPDDDVTKVFFKGIKNYEEIPKEISPMAAFKLKQHMANLGKLYNTGKTLKSTGTSASASPTDKELAALATRTVKALDEGLNDVANIAPFNTDYSYLSKVRDELTPIFRSTATTKKNLERLNKKGNETFLASIDDLEKRIPDLDISKDVSIMDAWTKFYSPDSEIKYLAGAKSSIPASAFLGTLGLLQGGVPLGLAGAGLGTLVGQPKTIKNLVGAALSLQNLGQKAYNFIPKEEVVYGASYPALNYWNRNNDDED